MSRTRCFALFSAAFLYRGTAQAEPRCSEVWLRPLVAPAPADNAVTPERVALGRMLFLDTRLSDKQNGRPAGLAAESAYRPSCMYGAVRAMYQSVVAQRRNPPSAAVSARPRGVGARRGTTSSTPALGSR
jgi:hypothetical protein